VRPEARRRETTIEEAARLRLDARWELVDGELRVLSPVGMIHAEVVTRVASRLDAFVRRKRLGKVFSGDPGFVLRRGPDTLRAPDVCFVRADRMSGRPPRGFFDGAPDLAIEVMSPEDRWTEVARKARQFLRAGSRAVWAIDPDRKTARIYSAAGTCTIDEDGILEEATLLPGFRLRLRDLP